MFVKFQLSSSRGTPITVEDYRKRARKQVPQMVWAYVDGGADALTTLRANVSAFDAWSLRARVLAGVTSRDLTVKLADTDLSLPVLLAPTGLTGLMHWSGEVGAARAAERAGTRAVISTSASYTPEEVSEATVEDHFFQLYPWASEGGKNRDLTAAILNRVRNSGFRTLFVTVDTPTHGNREGERRLGMGAPPVFTPGRIIDAALKPRWVYHFLKERRT